MTNVNSFGSKTTMESAGWAFNWNDAYTFTLDRGRFCPNVPSASYCGFRYPGDGSISLTLSGSGTVTVDYGNSYPNGVVTLYLNNEAIDSASASRPSKTKEFAFQVIMPCVCTSDGVQEAIPWGWNTTHFVVLTMSVLLPEW